MLLACSDAGLTSRNIAEIYFFEELYPLIGADASHRWLSDQVRSRSSSSKSTSPTPPIRATDSSSHGRDIPNAMGGGKGLRSSQGMDRQSKGRNKISDIGKDRKRRSPKRGPAGSPTSPTPSMTISLGLESSGQLLRRTNSVERKLGLLFTDAAHTILD